MWNCCTLTSIMDLWLHDQISDMIHHEAMMADIVWPIFKWPLNDHGHGLAENNPELPGASNFWTFESICISGTVADVFLLYFVPGMKWLHAVAVGWMYLIGVMEVRGGVDTGPCQKGSQYSKSTLSLPTDSVKKVLNVLRLTGSWTQKGILRHKIHFRVFL